MRWRSWVIITPPKRDEPNFMLLNDSWFFCRIAASFNFVFTRIISPDGKVPRAWFCHVPCENQSFRGCCSGTSGSTRQEEVEACMDEMFREARHLRNGE